MKMSPIALKDALKNCLINFDRRINVTDLLQQYELNYEEVNKMLEEHLNGEESKGVKYDKRFLVKGVERESKTEVFTVVQGEKKMKEWLKRLQNAEASLYSVEVAGGAKSPAYSFEPLQYHTIKLRSLKTRDKVKPIAAVVNGNASAATNGAGKQETKPKLPKSSGMNMFAKKATPDTAASSKNADTEAGTSNNAAANAATSKPAATVSKAKKNSPEIKKTSPEEKKTKNAAVGKKGIGNFFSANSNASTKTEDNKKDIKSSSPKKMQDFFKKQPDTPQRKPKENPKATPEKSVKQEANVSVQLFSAESSDSSDEEEKLNALKRDIITADNENSDSEKPTSSSKRRRIVDSDEEVDEPPQKIEKTVIVNIIEDDETPEQQQQSETYLDDDGFVITIKPKKTAGKSGGAKSGIAKVSPPRKSPQRKSPAKTAKPNATKTAAAGNKTKQGNIMNFFSKK